MYTTNLGLDETVARSIFGSADDVGAPGPAFYVNFVQGEGRGGGGGGEEQEKE